jgi:hypothetical protein
MSKKNILGVLLAAWFALSTIVAFVGKPIGPGLLDAARVMGIWIACGFWRYGEGVDDLYTKQQAFINGGAIAGIVFLMLRPVIDVALNADQGLSLVLYVTAAMCVFVRVGFYAMKSGAFATLLTLHPGQVGKFFLFQPPEQVRGHTRG